MQAGHLTEQIMIEQRVEGYDEAGQPIEGWAPYLLAWADIRHLSGLENIRAGAEVSQVNTSIRIRRRPGRNVKSAMRVIHDGTIYDIKAVLPNHRAAYLDLVCMTTGDNP